jgi:hypothetical protein
MRLNVGDVHMADYVSLRLRGAIVNNELVGVCRKDKVDEVQREGRVHRRFLRT